jgi:pilus assembly protein CpaB
MFKGRNLMLMLLALLLALGAVKIANNWVDSVLAPRSATADSLPIVVAASEIPFGVKVDATQVKLIDWPKASLPADYFSAIDQVIGKVSSQTIYTGDVLNKTRVREHLGGSALSALISPNMRAMSVRVNDVVGVSGFLLPGNRVDVLATRTEGMSKEATTHTILEDIKVLAVDQESSQDKEKPVVVHSVTLEVDPEQGELLVKATQEGSIQLALRNPMDRTALVKKAEPSTPMPTYAPKPASLNIVLIKGTSSSTVKCTPTFCQGNE